MGESKPIFYSAVEPFLEQDTHQRSQFPPKRFLEDGQQLRTRLVRRQLLAIAIFIICIVALVCLNMLAIGLVGPGAAGDYLNRCYEDRDASVSQSFLVFNVFLAQDLSFASAKAIDIGVNLVLGQGGRGLHAWIAYRVFSDAVTRSMEQSPMSYGFYLAAMFNSTSFMSTLTYTKSIFSNWNARQRWLALWFLFATIHVLLFPTLVSASTGYFSPLAEYWELPNGLLLSEDTWRWSSRNAFECYNATNPYSYLGSNASVVSTGSIWSYFRNVQNSTTILNPVDCVRGGTQLRCVQMGGYIWGLATWMVILACGLESIFVIGTFGVWWDANVKGELNSKGLKRRGVYRNIVDISEAIIGHIGAEHGLYTNADIMEAVQNEKIMLGMDGIGEHGSVHIGVAASHQFKVEIRNGGSYS